MMMETFPWTVKHSGFFVFSISLIIWLQRQYVPPGSFFSERRWSPCPHLPSSMNPELFPHPVSRHQKMTMLVSVTESVPFVLSNPGLTDGLGSFCKLLLLQLLWQSLCFLIANLTPGICWLRLVNFETCWVDGSLTCVVPLCIEALAIDTSDQSTWGGYWTCSVMMLASIWMMMPQPLCCSHCRIIRFSYNCTIYF